MWLNLLQQEEEAKKRLEQVATTDDDAKRLMTVPGVGPQTAVGMLVHIGGRHRALQEQQAVCGLPWACTKAEQHRWQQHAQRHHQMWPQEAACESRAMRQVDPHVRRKAGRGILVTGFENCETAAKKRGVIVCAIAAKIAKIIYRSDERQGRLHTRTEPLKVRIAHSDHRQYSAKDYEGNY